MSGIYTVSTGFQDVSAAQDLLEIVASATCVCVLKSFTVSVVGGTADAGDTNEQLLELRIRSGQTTSGNGTAVTPRPTDNSNGAATFTAERNGTTQATDGTIITHLEEGWNSRVGYQKVFTEEEQIIFGGSRRLTIEIPTAPTGTIKTCVTAVVQQIWS